MLLPWASLQFHTHMGSPLGCPKTYLSLYLFLWLQRLLSLFLVEISLLAYLGYKLHCLEAPVFPSVLLCIFTWLTVECLFILPSCLLMAALWTGSCIAPDTSVAVKRHHKVHAVACQAFCGGHFFFVFVFFFFFFGLGPLLKAAVSSVSSVALSSPSHPSPDPWTFGLLCHSDPSSYCGHNSLYISWEIASPNP